nr:DNA mismatch repair protein MLH3 isoform X1 [Tanacetum cinerariifolium]
IHKLLNQLAAMHSCSDLLKADSRSYCGKRSRCQASPTYVLNLTCPRAHYDLSFEPAKTCVEFKMHIFPMSDMPSFRTSS